MYYDNRSTFYIKEYGPSVAIVVVSIVLILSGALIYYNTAIKPNEEPIVAEKEDNPLVNVEKEDEVAKVKDNTYFINLPVLTKSKEVLVSSVKDVANDIILTVEDDESKISFKLIGVDTSYNTKAIKDDLQTNLVGRKVKIAFDKVRNENNYYKAYVFLDKQLYNAEILKKGLTTLYGERKNFALNKKLTQAQKYARSNSIGIWHK